MPLGLERSLRQLLGPHFRYVKLVILYGFTSNDIYLMIKMWFLIPKLGNFQWFLRDLTGMLGGVLFTFYQVHFELCLILKMVYGEFSFMLQQCFYKFNENCL